MTRRPLDPVTRAFNLIARYAAGEVSDEAEERELLEIWSSGQFTPTVEHAQRYSGGEWLVWNEAPELEAIYPTSKRIEHGQQHGGIVGRRRVIVLEDWRRVPRRRTKDA